MAGERRSLIQLRQSEPRWLRLAGFFADDGVVVALRLNRRLDVYDLGRRLQSAAHSIDTKAGLLCDFARYTFRAMASPIFALTFNRSILRRLNIALALQQFSIATDMLIALFFGQGLLRYFLKPSIRTVSLCLLHSFKNQGSVSSDCTNPSKTRKVIEGERSAICL